MPKKNFRIKIYNNIDERSKTKRKKLTASEFKACFWTFSIVLLFNDCSYREAMRLLLEEGIGLFGLPCFHCRRTSLRQMDFTVFREKIRNSNSNIYFVFSPTGDVGLDFNRTYGIRFEF